MKQKTTIHRVLRYSMPTGRSWNYTLQCDNCGNRFSETKDSMPTKGFCKRKCECVNQKKRQSLCMFCMKDHKGKTPKICQAKGDIMRAYCKELPAWQVMAAIESGLLNLEGEALVFMKKRAA